MYGLLRGQGSVSLSLWCDICLCDITVHIYCWSVNSLSRLLKRLYFKDATTKKASLGVLGKPGGIWSIFPEGHDLINCQWASIISSDLMHPQTCSSISNPSPSFLVLLFCTPAVGLFLPINNEVGHLILKEYSLISMNSLATASNRINIHQPNISSHQILECLLVCSSLLSSG